MRKESDVTIVKFFESFFKLYDAKIDNLKINENEIKGSIKWEDEAIVEEFSWKIVDASFNFKYTTELLDFLTLNRLVNGDMILLAKDLLICKLLDCGWDLNKINIAIDMLLSVSINRMDGDELLDYFFIHF